MNEASGDTTPPVNAASQPTFARRLNLFDATMIVISGIVGSGIFINPYVVAQAVGTPFLIIGVWVVGGLIALLGAFVFAELSTVMPRVGGQYAFFREAFHPMVAFLHGWSLLLMIQSGATGAVAVAFAEYVIQLAGLPRTRVTWLAAGVMMLLAGFHALGVLRPAGSRPGRGGRVWASRRSPARASPGRRAPDLPQSSGGPRPCVRACHLDPATPA